MAIEAWKKAALREHFNKGTHASEAAKYVGVSKETAYHYYQRFRLDLPMPPGPLPLRGTRLQLNQYQLHEVADPCERYGYAKVNCFIQDIIDLVIKEKLYVAILGTPNEWKEDRAKTKAIAKAKRAGQGEAKG